MNIMTLRRWCAICGARQPQSDAHFHEPVTKRFPVCLILSYHKDLGNTEEVVLDRFKFSRGKFQWSNILSFLASDRNTLDIFMKKDPNYKKCLVLMTSKMTIWGERLKFSERVVYNRRLSETHSMGYLKLVGNLLELPSILLIIYFGPLRAIWAYSKTFL